MFLKEMMLIRQENYDAFLNDLLMMCMNLSNITNLKIKNANLWH